MRGNNARYLDFDPSDLPKPAANQGLTFVLRVLSRLT